MTSSSKDPFAPFDSPFRDFLLRHNLVSPGGPRWGVAVSGGGDSVFLLTLLFRHRPPNQPLDILYFNHHTDPQKNSRDQDFVASLANRCNARFLVGESPAPEKRRPNVSETILRQERQAFFRAYLDRTPSSILFVGHQKDDRIETVLANLFRGTGPRGLMGIREKSGKIYRPLLFLGREEIRHVLREANHPFMEDPTNEDLGPLRNRIRLELRPAIDRLFPHGTEHLDSLAQIMAREISAPPPLPTGLLLSREEPGVLTFSLRLFQSLPPSRQAEFSRSLLERQSRWNLPLPPERNLLRTLSNPPTSPLRRFPLGVGWHLDIVSDHVILVYLYPETQNMTLPMAAHLKTLLREGGKFVSIPLPRGGSLTIARQEEDLRSPFSKVLPSRPLLTAFLSQEVIKEGAKDLCVTYRRRDLPLWIPPPESGEEGPSPRPSRARTVDQLLSRRPIPAATKDRLPILTFREKALWIPGELDRTRDWPVADQSPYLSITFQAQEPSWWKKFLENP